MTSTFMIDPRRANPYFHEPTTEIVFGKPASRLRSDLHWIACATASVPTPTVVSTTEPNSDPFAAWNEAGSMLVAGLSDAGLERAQ